MRRPFIIVLLLLALATAAAAQQRARISVILPTFGAPGTTVTIRGAGFSGFESGSWVKASANEPPPGAVEFNGVPGDVVFWQDDLITVKVPIGASTGPVRVILSRSNVALTGDSFEVPYSKPSGRAPEHSTSGTPSMGINDGSPESFISRGNEYYQRRDYRSAISQYDRALTMSANSVEALQGLGAAYSRLGMYSEAISATNRILNIAPDNANAYVSLSWYYSFSDQYQAAMDAGRMAVKKAPNNYTGYTNLCRAYNDLERYQDALDTCRRALELKPGDGESSFYMGRAYLRLNQQAKSAPLFQTAVAGLVETTKQRPDDADGFYLLANAYNELKQDEQAVKSYRQAIDLKPRFPHARFNLGVTLQILGRSREALEQQEQLKAIDPVRAARLLQIIKGR